MNEDCRTCARCGLVRRENSFYADDTHPVDVCKPCIHRPIRRSITNEGCLVRAPRGRRKRAHEAILKFVETFQNGGQSLVYVAKVRRQVKIGYSSNVIQRLRQLATASSHPIWLLAVVPGGRQLEQDLHRQFSDLRMQGEWFRHPRLIIPVIAQQQGAMVFLEGYLSEHDPLLNVTE